MIARFQRQRVKVSDPDYQLKNRLASLQAKPLRQTVQVGAIEA